MPYYLFKQTILFDAHRHKATIIVHEFSTRHNRLLCLPTRRFHTPGAALLDWANYCVLYEPPRGISWFRYHSTLDALVPLNYCNARTQSLKLAVLFQQGDILFGEEVDLRRILPETSQWCPSLPPQGRRMENIHPWCCIARTVVNSWPFSHFSFSLPLPVGLPSTNHLQEGYILDVPWLHEKIWYGCTQLSVHWNTNVNDQLWVLPV